MTVGMFIALWLSACMAFVGVLCFYARRAVDPPSDLDDLGFWQADTPRLDEPDWALFDALREQWATLGALRSD